MTAQADPVWTPEQTDAALALAITENAPRWAEGLFLTMLSAREAAPDGEADAWAEAARVAFIAEVGNVGDRMALHVQASAERTVVFAREIADAITARLAELKAGLQTGGRA